MKWVRVSSNSDKNVGRRQRLPVGSDTYPAGVFLANHALRNVARLKAVVQSKTTNVRMSTCEFKWAGASEVLTWKRRLPGHTDALHSGQVFHLSNLDITSSSSL